MKTPFFITGLPRSRTSWLANLFTYGQAFCHHDASKAGANIGALRKVMQATSAHYGGDSDSGLLHYFDDVLTEYPNARWLVVVRNKVAAHDSFRKYFDGRPYGGVDTTQFNSMEIFDQLQFKLNRLSHAIPKSNRIFLHFDCLENETHVREAWEFLTPENPWNAARYQMLQAMQVNPFPEKVRLQCR